MSLLVSPTASSPTVFSAAEQTPDRPAVALGPNAGVVTQGKTAAEAMAANSSRMTQTLAALRQAGLAERDLQTSTLSLQPQYHYLQREPPAPAPTTR